MHMYCTVVTAVFRECLYRAAGFEDVICVYQLCVSNGKTVLKSMAVVNLAKYKVTRQYVISYI